MVEIKDTRNESYGQYKTTIVDKFGVFLSVRSVRKIFKKIGNLENMSILDIGCGYHATMLTKFSSQIHRGIGIDVSINPTLKQITNLEFIETPFDEATKLIKGQSVDGILFMSVLEHLTDPLYALIECQRMLKSNGILIINVPTWIGKFFLEYSAFKLHLSPALEMDDHKMYYNKRDIWPILIKAGFKPSNINLSYHKFGLNLFAVVTNK